MLSFFVGLLVVAGAFGVLWLVSMGLQKYLLYGPSVGECFGGLLACLLLLGMALSFAVIVGTVLLGVCTVLSTVLGVLTIAGSVVLAYLLGLAVRRLPGFAGRRNEQPLVVGYASLFFLAVVLSALASVMSIGDAILSARVPLSPATPTVVDEVISESETTLEGGR